MSRESHLEWAQIAHQERLCDSSLHHAGHPAAHRPAPQPAVPGRGAQICAALFPRSHPGCALRALQHSCSIAACMAWFVQCLDAPSALQLLLPRGLACSTGHACDLLALQGCTCTQVTAASTQPLPIPLAMQPCTHTQRACTPTPARCGTASARANLALMAAGQLETGDRKASPGEAAAEQYSALLCLLSIQVDVDAPDHERHPLFAQAPFQGKPSCAVAAHVQLFVVGFAAVCVVSCLLLYMVALAGGWCLPHHCSPPPATNPHYHVSIPCRLRAGGRPDAVHPAWLVALRQVHHCQLLSVFLVALSWR